MASSTKRTGSAAIGAIVGFALSMTGSPGCVQSVFTCSEDANCEKHGEGGVCESNNFCTFPDEACPTGRRWHSRAGDLASECVEGDMPATGGEQTGTSGDAESSDDGVAESSSGNDTTPLTSGDSSSTTMPPDPGSTSDPGESSGAPTTGGAASCDEQFGGATDYLYCTETADSCTFVVTVAMVDSCNGVCTAFGGTCLEQHSNDVDLCTSTGLLTCDDMTSNDVICVCSRM